MFADPLALARLGTEVIAARVAGGRVPEFCTALGLDGRITQRHPAGAKVEAPRQGKLWWVHDGPFHLRFAPVAAAPEAGVSLRIEPVRGYGVAKGLIGDELAFALDRRPSPVLTLADLEAALTGHPLLHIPPCAQADELEAIRHDLNTALIPRFGLVCARLQRLDLFPEHRCRETCADTEKTSATRREAVDESRLEGHVPQVVPVPPPLGDLIRADDEFQHRLFIELPRLAQGLRNIRYPEEQAAFQLHVGLQQRLEHLAGTTNRLPALENRIDNRKIPELTVRLLAEEGRQAMQSLDALWPLLSHPEATPDYGRLEQGVLRLETHIARRRAPWWRAEE